MEGLDGKEILFAQSLASNTLKVRNKTLTKLQRFIQTLDEDSVTDEELLKLWKGLFYCMWMSDKPKVQQELALRIASLLHYFATPEGSFQFLKCFLITMNREWHGIDNLRLNKFYSLVRRMIEESLKVAISDIFNQSKENSEEEEEDVEKESELIFLWSAAVCEALHDGAAPAVVLHLCDVFMESFEKALPKLTPGDQILSDVELSGLLLPFYDLIQGTGDVRIANRVSEEIFKKILTSKFEEEYNFDEDEKFESDLERHNFYLSATYKYFPYFDGVEEALLALATKQDTRDKNRKIIFTLQDNYQKIRVPIPPKQAKKVKYQPLTSEEAAMLRKRKPKKNRKKPATKKQRTR